MIREITTEDERIMIDRYLAGISFLDIGKELDLDRKTISRHVQKYIDDGTIKKRERAKRKTYGEDPEAIARNAEKWQKSKKRIEWIISLYNNSKNPMSYKEIADQVDLSDAYVKSIIKKLISTGRLTRRDSDSKSIREYKRKREFLYTEKSATLAEGETVRCTRSVAKTCIYGYDHPNAFSGLCKYSQITGHCRTLGVEGCPPDRCTRYSKVSKANPRLKVKGE